jgi:hypothetical protein
MNLRRNVIGVVIKKKKRKKKKRKMNSIIISRDDIVKLLEKSYEQGYDGYLDLKDDCVLEILNNYLISKKPTMPYLNPPSSSLTVSNPNESILNGLYAGSYHSEYYGAQNPSNSSISTNSTSNSTIDSGQITISFNY